MSVDLGLRHRLLGPEREVGNRPTLAIPDSILNQLDGLKDSIFAVTLPSDETQKASHLLEATQ